MKKLFFTLILFCHLAVDAQTVVKHQQKTISKRMGVVIERRTSNLSGVSYALYFQNSSYQYITDLTFTPMTKVDLEEFSAALAKIIGETIVEGGEASITLNSGLRLTKTKAGVIGDYIAFYDKDNKSTGMPIGKARKMYADVSKELTVNN